MRIAHINNTAGIASTLAIEQRKHGHTADVFVFAQYRQQQFGGILIDYNRTIGKWRFFQKLKSYDIWHYHSPFAVKKKDILEHSDQKKILRHYHGTELRGGLETECCLVSTPDLLKYAPKGIWLPNPVDIEEVEMVSKEVGMSPPHSIPIIAHYPYYKISHYEDNYSATLHALEKEGRCRVVTALNVTHIEALRVIAQADIVLGKIMPEMGWFGRFELEGMALGKPAVAFVSDELYGKYNPPIWRTTKETFKEDLQNLLNSKSDMEKLSKEGREYVYAHHRPEDIVRRLEKYYSDTGF